MFKVIIIYFIRNTQDLKVKANARNADDVNNSRRKYVVNSITCRSRFTLFVFIAYNQIIKLVFNWFYLYFCTMSSICTIYIYNLLQNCTSMSEHNKI